MILDANHSPSRRRQGFAMVSVERVEYSHFPFKLSRGLPFWIVRNRYLIGRVILVTGTPTVL